MAKFVDLNLQNELLVKLEFDAGFSKVQETRVVELSSKADFKKISSDGVCVEGKDALLLREACRNRKVSFINPVFAARFERDDGLIREVILREKVFEIPVCSLLHAKHVFRAKQLAQLREFLRRCIKFNAGFVFTSRAKEREDVKSPREIIAIAHLMGLSREQAARALSFNGEEE
ncbi:MAG: RNase P subunit p30 family protein [Candidatus Micrarchaeia archaeon]